MDRAPVVSTQSATIYFDTRRNRFTSGVTQGRGHQGTSGAMGSTSATERGIPITLPEGRNLADTLVNINQIGAPLLNAIGVMGSLKVRMLDSHNHGVQTEILKLVRIASSDGPDAETARIVLKGISQDPRLKLLLTRALASVMGDAPWIQDARTKSGSGESGMASAADAAKVLLALTDGKNPSLTHDDCMKALQQFSNHKVLLFEESPFWEGIRSLSITQREQLGDCFGQYSRADYVKRREYFKVSDAYKILNDGIDGFLAERDTLKELCKAFSLFGIKFEKNGFNIPQNFEIPSSIEGINSELVDKHRASVSAFREAWRKFQINPEDTSLKPEEKELCQAFQEAQKQFGGEQGTLESLEEKRETLKGELLRIGRCLSQRDPLSAEESSLRRSLMAGKPNATPADCWNAITSFSGSEFQVLGNYDAWLAVVKEQERHIAQANMETERLRNPENTFNFQEGIQLAGQLKELKVWYEDDAKVQAFKTLQNGIFVLLGDVPEETILRDGVVTLARDNMRILLHTAVHSLLPGRTDIPAFAGEDLGQNIKAVEKFLNTHQGIDTTIADQIREMLAFAKEISA